MIDMKYIGNPIKFLLLIIVGLIAFDDSAASVNMADSAYLKGQYAEAIEIYGEIADSKGISSELLYNIANSYARLGDYGNATLFYLRSLQLDPGNKKARENLAYVGNKVSESNQSELRGKKYSLEPEEETFFSNIRLKIVKERLSNTWAVIAAVCFIIFICCIAIYIFVKEVTVRKIGFFGGFIMLALSIITLIFSFMASSYKSDEGVILAPKVKLHSEASISSKESPINLTRGTVMKILDVYPSGDSDSKPEWYKVRLNSDFIGWIKSSDFAAVESDS